MEILELFQNVGVVVHAKYSNMTQIFIEKMKK